MFKPPFLPMNLNQAKRFSKIFAPFGRNLSRLKPSLTSELVQLEIDATATQYMSMAFLAFTLVTLSMFSLLLILMLLLFNGQVAGFLILISVSALIMGLFSFLQFTFYPQNLLMLKAKKLNRDLLFALRHLLIQVRSGVPLYNAIVSLSQADYGIVSKEFKQTAKEMSGGLSQTEALSNMLMRTPSVYLRRVVWQISNALRAGSDLSNVIETLVKEFTDEERVRLQRFGKELSPWALMYLMFTVIFPTMGIAMLLVLTSLAPITISNEMFAMFVIFFTAFQFFFIKFLKSKRPSVRF